MAAQSLRETRSRGWQAGQWPLGFAALLAGATVLPPAHAQPPAGPAHCDVLIETVGGAHRFRAELAATPEQRAEGLQGRTRLADDAGMLFDFGTPQAVAMWMKNTPISLDMLFIAGDGRVAAIAERTVPYSLDTIAAPAPVRAVLEVRGGTAQRIGLKAGARLTSPCLVNAPPP